VVKDGIFILLSPPNAPCALYTNIQKAALKNKSIHISEINYLGFNLLIISKLQFKTEN